MSWLQKFLYGSEVGESSEYTGPEFAKIPDWYIKQAEKFLRSPNPVPIDSETLSGIWLVHDYELKDPHYASQIESRKNALLSQDYDIVSGGDRKVDMKARDFVEWNIEHLDFTIHNVFDATLDAISKGFAIAETIYEYCDEGEWDGYYRVKSLKDKDQRYFRFRFDHYGNLDPSAGLVQTNEFGMETSSMPPNKFFIYTFGRRRDNWDGEGLGERCLWYMFFKKNAIKAWNIFLQKFGNPTVIGRHPPGVNQAKIDDFLDSIKQLSEQSGIVFPDGPEGQQFVIELLEATRGGEGGYISFMQYIDTAISKRILGGTLTSDPGTKGARSLGQVHQQNRIALARFDALTLQDAFNEQVLKRLTRLNFRNAKPPKLQFRMISSLTRKEWLESMVLAQQIGMPIDPQWAHDVLQIPVPEGDEYLIPNQNVRLGHRGGADPLKKERTSDVENEVSGRNEPSAQMSFLERYGAKRELTKWENTADIVGETILMDQINTTSFRLGVSASQHVRDCIFEEVKRKRYGKKPSLSPISINIAPLRDFIQSSQLNSFYWGAVCAVENLQKLGFKYSDDKYPNIFSNKPKEIHSRMFLPSEVDIIQHFTDKLPFSGQELKTMREGVMELSKAIVTLTHNKFNNIINPIVDTGNKSWHVVKNDLIGALLPYTGSISFRAIETGDSIDAPNLVSLVKQCNYDAFNRGKLAVFQGPECSDFLGGLQFVGLISPDNLVNDANDAKTYDQFDERWTWLCSPLDSMARSTVVAVPQEAISSLDKPPVPDIINHAI